MNITKKDLLTIVVLSTLFFGVATWNLGLSQSPIVSWQETEKQYFYIDLGGIQPVKTAYFFVKLGNANVSVYSGSLGNWSRVGQFMLTNNDGWEYFQWKECSFSTNTRYLRFGVEPVRYDARPMFSNWGITNPSDKEPSPFVEVLEIAVLSQSNQQIPIVGITGENASDPSLSKLVDEQSLVQIPPSYMSETFFDEVYFARSAADYLNHQVPHERTHPPLGKLIQSIGIAVFGEVPFGWRVMGIIFATLMIPLMYLLGKKLFGTWIGGFSAAFLLSFDFMHFTMSRMGTADTYVVFFSMLSQLFFLIYFMNVIKEGWKTSIWPLFAAVVFVALGFSTKWIVAYGAVGMLALLAATRLKEVSKLRASLSAKYVAFFEHPFLLILGFVGVVAVIYLVTYIPDMLTGTSFPTIINLQFSMLSFHSGLGIAGNYWWSWPFVLKPHWLDVWYLPDGSVSTINLLGNLAVWWVGFACVILLIEKAFPLKELYFKLGEKLTHKVAPVMGKRKWDLEALFIVFLFFFQWLPYVLISRVTYIYHFYVNVPILCLASAYFINKIWNKKYGKAATIAYLAVVVAVFVLFYAVISGMPTTRSWIDSLKLLGNTWLQP